VMTSLAEKEGLKGKVQMIYLDPPYGIKFGSNWQVSTRKRDVKDGKAEDATRQPEQIRAFRDTWQYGIHSYLTYLRDRLVVARELLSETGSVFVQIGDENVHLVRGLMDEVFGSENFCVEITYAKTTSATTELLAGTTDYILWYAKARAHVKYRQLYLGKEAGSTGATKYTNLLLDDGSISTPIAESENGDLPRGSRLCTTGGLTSQRPPGDFPVMFDGVEYGPGSGYWKTGKTGMSRVTMAGRVVLSGSRLRYVRLLDDFAAYPITNLWADIGGIQSRADPKVFVVQTATVAIERCLLMTTDPGDLVLDPTCGGGTTAYVAEEWGRRWITIDTLRVALALARTRLMAAKFPYYLLADSPDGVRKIAEIEGRMPPDPMPKTDSDIRKGLVPKRMPHVTLKSIANNEEIDVIHAKWQEKLEPLRKELNKALKQTWEEWQIPREADAKWSDKAKQAHKEWWRLRRERQQEIDASIAKRADTELLHDQPYEDNKRIRVTGPFTVESLSPHRVLATDTERPKAESEQVKAASGQFETMIFENLKRAGVKSTDKKLRIAFDRLEPFAGTWLHASGEFTESETGKRKRIAVSIGPEHGTVGPEQVKEAAKEAVLGVGFDVLVVCGFAFDPHVREETRRYGKLVVLPALMNPDLSMGEELLKKTGAANLFMVFGEPDVAPVDAKTGKLLPQRDGKYVIEIRGVDVYDPTTGEIRSNKTDDIACWFIDTDYNGESFFVRHAYFCGDQEPYDRLKRALRAEIDEAAWSALYSTKSIPFDKPKTGKVAIKVINHYGDEVLKVLSVAT
jgi:adenine-specific DNA-methyltransferase